MRNTAARSSGSAACQKRVFDRLVDGEILSPLLPPLDRFHLNPSDSGREICKEAIFLSENGIFLHKNSHERDVHAAALDFSGCPVQVFRHNTAARSSGGGIFAVIPDCVRRK